MSERILTDSSIIIMFLLTNVMWVIWCMLHLKYAHEYENPSMTVSLFVDEEHIDKMKRNIIPSVGDTIVIDCGNLVKVIEVNHDWGTPDLIQINCISVKKDD